MMSVAMINRSLTSIRTELEFLRDSQVITTNLYEELLNSIPTKYQKDMKPWDIDKLNLNRHNKSCTDTLSNDLINLNINTPDSLPIKPPSNPPNPPNSQDLKPLGFCKALYDYNSSEPGDLNFHENENIIITEHLSENWWKGYKNNTSKEKIGVFPSNYVKIITKQEFDLNINRLPPPLKNSNDNEKFNNYHDQYIAPPPQYDQPASQRQPLIQLTIQQPSPQQPFHHIPSYSGYAQFPPPSTNYYIPHPVEPVQQAPVEPVQQAPVVQPQPPSQAQQPEGDSIFKKFGSKLGNAAIFGAGSTFGSDIVHSIF